MDSREFREFGKAAVDYIADYFETIRSRRVLHSVEPGYLEQLIPNEVPKTGEHWKELLKDMERIIMPGLTHWHNPNFHGYFTAANSFPAVVGEMMSSAICSIGINWNASPVYTELEVAMMNWLGKLLNLPNDFLNCSPGPGGGSLQGSASETTLLCLLAAKERKVHDIKKIDPLIDAGTIKAKLVAYSSDQANSSVERAALLGSMAIKLLPADRDGKLRASTLSAAILKDKSRGLIPCYVVACLGTTPTCAFDDLSEIGPVCEEEGLWLHIDAAYAGAAFACPEYRYLMKGMGYADSFNFNPHKWMLVNFDCSAMWLKDASWLVNPFAVDRVYLEPNELPSVPELRHWKIPLGGRFRALKLWFVLRAYGVEGIQNYIRNHIFLAKYFEKLVRSDGRFIVVSSSMGLVCFRLNGNRHTQKLYDGIIDRGNMYMTQGDLNQHINIRFCVCSRTTEIFDIDNAWAEILSVTDRILPLNENKPSQCGNF